MATKFKDDEIVVAVEAFVTSCLPSGPFPVAVGQRLRADHPVVKATSAFWVADGTPSDEIARVRARIYVEAEEAAPVAAPVAQINRRMKDADVLVAIRAAGRFVAGTSGLDTKGEALAVPPGARVHKKSAIVKEDPDAFVPVQPKGLARKDALLALERLEHVYENGEREVVYAGTLIPRDHPAVERHPYLFQHPVSEEEG